MNFEVINLGQTVVKYKVPLDIYITINQIYESKFNELLPANHQLVGKIKNEHSLFYNGQEGLKLKKHNYLPLTVLKWFEQCYLNYLDCNNIKGHKIHLTSIWVNTMFEHEYNPIHIHQGDLYTGLSSVMILKLPKSFGTEYSSPDNPQNGKLQILGSANGQFALIDYQPKIRERDFYVFPYDMRHCVYPFNGPDYRRTLAANCDVDYNPITNRGAT